MVTKKTLKERLHEYYGLFSDSSLSINEDDVTPEQDKQVLLKEALEHLESDYDITIEPVDSMFTQSTDNKFTVNIKDKVEIYNFESYKYQIRNFRKVLEALDGDLDLITSIVSEYISKNPPAKDVPPSKVTTIDKHPINNEIGKCLWKLYNEYQDHYGDLSPYFKHLSDLDKSTLLNMFELEDMEKGIDVWTGNDQFKVFKLPTKNREATKMWLCIKGDDKATVNIPWVRIENALKC